MGEINNGDELRAFVKYPSQDLEILADFVQNIGGWDSLYCATDINEDGVIVGAGLYQGETRVFRMTPVKKGLEYKADLPLLVE